MNIIIDDKCPICGKSNFEEDFTRCEVYCKDCGTVLSMPYDYVGGVKVQNLWSYHFGKVRAGVEAPRWIGKDSSLDIRPANKITRYRHNIPDKRLFGRRVKRK